MKLNTMASVLTFVTSIENDSADFYEAEAEKHPALADELKKWAKENRRFAKQVKQTYFGIITDTLESNYCFEGLDTDNYVLNLEPVGDADDEALKARAAEIEKTIGDFYQKAGELSDGLMADIPRLFKKIASKRQARELA